jgi:hypothetical protein
MASVTLAGIVYLLAIREFFATPTFARRVVVIGLVLAAVWHIEFLRAPAGKNARFFNGYRCYPSQRAVFIGVPDGIRTHVIAVKGRCPGPG